MANLNKKAFQKRYLDIFTGSLSYPYVNSFPSNTTAFSLYLDAIPTVDASRKVLLSVGNAGSNVLFEVGISTNDKVFVYNGTTEFEAGEALVSDTSYNITVVYGNSSMNVYINDNSYFTGLDLASIEGLDISIGESILTGDFYTGYLKDVILFASEHSSKTVGTVTNQTFFEPSDLDDLAAWYEAKDVDYLLTPAAQTDPELYDWRMEESGTAKWFENGGTITKETADPSQEGGQYMKITSTAGQCYFGQYNKFIAGNRYIVDILYKSPFAGSYPSSHPYGEWNTGTATLTEWTRITQEHTWTTYIYPNSRGITTGEYAYWDDQRTNNISRTEWYPSAGSIGGKLTQSNALYQPWWNSSSFSNHGGLRSTTSDAIVDNTATSSWINASNGAGFSFSLPVRVDNLTTHIIFATCVRSSNNIGCILTLGSTGTFSLNIANGTGTYSLELFSSVGLIAADNEYIISGTIASGTNAVNIRLNGVSAATGTLTDPSSSNPSSHMTICGHAAGSTIAFQGSIGDIIFVNSVWSDEDRDNAEAYLSTKYKIVLG